LVGISKAARISRSVLVKLDISILYGGGGENQEFQRIMIEQPFISTALISPSEWVLIHSKKVSRSSTVLK
jgi:hypothetical protein